MGSDRAARVARWCRRVEATDRSIAALVEREVRRAVEEERLRVATAAKFYIFREFNGKVGTIILTDGALAVEAAIRARGKR